MPYSAHVRRFFRRQSFHFFLRGDFLFDPLNLPLLVREPALPFLEADSSNASNA